MWIETCWRSRVRRNSHFISAPAEMWIETGHAYDQIAFAEFHLCSGRDVDWNSALNLLSPDLRLISSLLRQRCGLKLTYAIYAETTRPFHLCSGRDVDWNCCPSRSSAWFWISSLLRQRCGLKLAWYIKQLFKIVISSLLRQRCGLKRAKSAAAFLAMSFHLCSGRDVDWNAIISSGYFAQWHFISAPAEMWIETDVTLIDNIDGDYFISAPAEMWIETKDLLLQFRQKIYFISAPAEMWIETFSS